MLMLVWAFACGVGQGEQGPPGPEGPEGPRGPMGPSGDSAAPYHWVDEAGDVVFPGPNLLLFNAQGAAWGVDLLSGDVGQALEAPLYFESTDCTGPARVFVNQFNRAVLVFGLPLMLPPGGSWQEADEVELLSQEFEDECTPTFGAANFRTALTTELIPAGSPPQRFWTGGIYPVEGAP